MRYFAVILAAGESRRMKRDGLPKPFYRLAGKPVLLYSVERFLSFSEIEKLYLVIAEALEAEFCRLLAELPEPLLARIELAFGGQSRAESLDLALHEIARRENLDAEAELVILTHDAARPFVSAACLREHLSRMSGGETMLSTALPLSDTLLRVEAERVFDVPDRRSYALAQTPQSFFWPSYWKVKKSLDPELFRTATDLTSLYTAAGEKPSFVLGEINNFKLTEADDLKRAEFYLQKERVPRGKGN